MLKGVYKAESLAKGFVGKTDTYLKELSVKFIF